MSFIIFFSLGKLQHIKRDTQDQEEIYLAAVAGAQATFMGTAPGNLKEGVYFIASL